MEAIYLLYVETSDQYGTSRVLAAFSSQANAESEQAKITRSRSFIRKIPLDPVFPVPRSSEEILREIWGES